MHDSDFHSGDKPQESLKGGMEMPHTQAPQQADAMTNPRSAGEDNIGQTWNATSLRDRPAPNSSNSTKAH